MENNTTPETVTLVCTGADGKVKWEKVIVLNPAPERGMWEEDEYTSEKLSGK